MKASITVLGGDGIGPEVAAEGVRDFGFHYLGQAPMSGGRAAAPIYEVRATGDRGVVRT